ncbi:MAG: methyltransferase domain-containing protein [Myxococcota bacterium]
MNQLVPSTLRWSEFEPRLSLIESNLEGRRVLDVGTRDARSLMRLVSAGASQVIGVCPEPDRCTRRGQLPPAVDLVAMESGRLDFSDGRFDVVIVEDLATECSAQPRFLHELRRVLSPDGVALLAFEAAGRSWSGLLDEDGLPPTHDSERLTGQIEKLFQGVRLFVQTPFVGVSIHPEGEAPFSAGISLDPRRDREPPSHLLALVGVRGTLEAQHTLVELSFRDVREQSERRWARAEADRQRLIGALGLAKRALTKREASLRQLEQRLPRIRSAIQRLGADLPMPLPASTQVEPTPSEVPQTAALQARVRELEEELARVSEPPIHSSQVWEEAESRPPNEPASWAQSAELERRLEEKDQDLQELRARFEAFQASQQEAELRSTRTLESRLHEARAEHAAELAAERAQAERTAEAWAERLREKERELEARQADWAQRLHVARQEVDALQAQIAEQEGEGLREQLEAISRASDADRARLERALMEAQHESETVGARYEEARLHAETQKRELDRVAARLRQEEGDRRALEMAASHLSQEVQLLRSRCQSLREERDALGQTSEMLLEERDQATELAQRVSEVESELGRALGAIEVVTQQRDEARTLARNTAQRLEEIAEAKRDAEARAVSLKSDASDRIRQLEDALGAATTELESVKAERDLLSSRRQVDEPDITAKTEIAESRRDQERLQDLLSEMASARAEAEQALATALADKARAEAAAVDIQSARREHEVRVVLATSELVRLRTELARRLQVQRSLEAELSAVRAQEQSSQERERLQSALSDATQQAAYFREQAEQAQIQLSEQRLRTAALSTRAENLEEELRGAKMRAPVRIPAYADAEPTPDRVEARRAAESRAQILALQFELDEVKALQHLRTSAESHSGESAEVVGLRSALAEADDRAEAAQGHVRRLEKDVDSWRCLAEQLEAAASARDDELERLSTEIGRAFEDRSRAEGELNALQAELEHAQRLATQSADERETALRRAEALEAEVRGQQAEVDTLRRRLQEAQSEAAAATQRQSELEARQRELDHELQGAREQIEEIRADRRASGAELERLRMHQAGLESALSHIEEERDRLRDDVAALNEQHQLTDRDWQRTRSELQTLKARHEDQELAHQAALEGLEQELRHAREERLAARSEAERSAIRADLAEARGATATRELEARLQELEAQMRDADQQLTTAVESVKAAREERQAKQGEVDRLERRARELMAELEALERDSTERLRDRDEHIESLASELRQLQERRHQDESVRLRKALTALGETEARADRVARELEGVQRSLDESRHSRDVQMKNFDAVRRELEKQVRAHRAQSEEHERLLRQVMSEKSELSHELQSMRQRILQSERTVESQRQTLTELERRLTEGQRAEERASAADERLSVVERDLAAARAECDEARAEVGRRLNELRALKEELDAERERSHQQASQLRELQEDSGGGDSIKLRRAIELRDSEINRLRAEIETLAAEKQRLRISMQTSEQDQVKLERRLVELEAAQDEQQRRMEQLRRELQDKNDRLRRLTLDAD